MNTAPLTRRTLLRNALLTASAAALPSWPLAAQTTAPSPPDSQAQAWSLATPLIRRTLGFHPTTGLVTTQFSCLATHADYINPHAHPAPEFSFQVNGQPCSGAGPHFTLLSATPAGLPNGKSLTLHLRHHDLPLHVDAVYTVYETQTALRKHLVLHNTGAAPLHISHLVIESLALSLGPADEITLLTQYGAIPRETFYTGRSEDAGLLIANAKTGHGIAILSEVPGYMKRTEINGFYDPDRIRFEVLYDTDLMPFERSIPPGASFTTAASSLVAFRNNDPLNDPHWRIPSYTAQVLERRVNHHGPPWIYNTWEPFHRTINHDIALQLIQAAGAMGMDIFTIDDGWQQEYGENDVNLTAFPGGLQPILDAVAALGMKLGLWVPLAAIGVSTPGYRNHPEWAALDQQAQPKTTGTAAGTKGVLCMASDYREAAADRLLDLIARYHPAYLKLDLTTVFNAYGEAPGCWAKGHLHGNWAESLNLIYEGIAYVTSRVYEKHPEILLDLTFELWGQKHVIDAGLLAAGDLDWLSNVGDREPTSAGPLQARLLLYQRTPSMPAESMLIGNLHADIPSIQQVFATAIGSAPVLLGDLRTLTPADRQWYHEKITWFKNLRRTIPISQSFFPLGSWLQPNAAAWDGFARLATTGSGIVALFRNQATAPTATLQLPLLPAGRYKLHSVITGNNLGLHTQSALAAGIQIDFSTPGPVEILEITAQNPL